MPTPESTKSAPEVEQLAQALGRLLNCPDLNLDEPDDETGNAIEVVPQALASINVP